MEAVRIRRRGGEGAILNSKGEFNRSHIPRLVLEEKENVTEEQKREQEKKNNELDEWLHQWEQEKTDTREQERSTLASSLGRPSPTPSSKRAQEQPQHNNNKKRRKLKFQLLDSEWGEQEPPSPSGRAKTTFLREGVAGGGVLQGGLFFPQ